MTAVARYPDSTKASLEQRLRARARERWPQIASLQIRHPGGFSYVDATLTDATTLKLCRLRYVGSASQWQFAIYRASHDDYDESVFPTGLPVGTCQDALDTACGLYLNDPTAWIQPPTNLRARPLRLPTWAFFVPGAVAGSAMPSLGAMVRTRWSVLLAGSPRLHTAFSFESVADELCFIVGPAAVTLLATEVSPASGVGVAAVLCLVGTLWFAAERGTEPTVVRPERPASRAGRRAGRVRGVPAPGLIVLAPVYMLLGAMFVSIDLSTVAFAQHFGHKPLAGLILGTYAFGSATGGIWYGTRHWRAPVEKRFALALTLTVLGVATFWAQPNLVSLTCVIYLCGLAIAPTLIAGFSLLEAQAKPGRRTEAMSWLSSGISIGVAVGASVVGFVIDAHGPRFGYVVAAVCGAASAAICLAGLGRLKTAAVPTPAGS